MYTNKNGVFVPADFDNTTFHTIDGPPSGIGVEEAYALAIEQVLGLNAAEVFRETGLQNRAPIEVAAQVAPGATGAELIELNQKITNVRMEILLAQIDNEWPQPTAGYEQFTKRIAAERKWFGKQAITSALLSSGHLEFINKSYETQGIEIPEIIVVQETLPELATKHLDQEYKIEDLTKPDERLMTIGISEWLGRIATGGGNGVITAEDIDMAKSRTIYVGDDRDKDGQLAENSGVMFVHLDPSDPEPGWENAYEQLVTPLYGDAQ